ncbi:MAG: glycosyltransferase family 39 protein [Thermoanaerobaculaceae bacterium]|nr:glycosyltransferase family 39 protein [Thermoanaerobaculaceae bacterium]MDI9620932.1 glycosyltransferase family 39 protein [Acidobacteriota bacterium]NLH10585.1 glycosyltransferase family 39 protein [Holophagae bacterium]HPW56662.1 glycosyltransferase family 39 protein [Thermoanaerobaculaceae bacterium]
MRGVSRSLCEHIDRVLGRLAPVVAWRGTPAVLVVVAVLLAGAAGWNSSATADEPYHTLAAWVYAHDGHADLNPEHPALVKLLAGLSLQPLGLRGPEGPPVERLQDLSLEVRRFLYQNTHASQTILRVARLPGLAFLALLLAGTYLWGRFAWGRTAGLLALVAVAGQPLVLGHAPIVHTDVAAAATWVWTGYLLHRWLTGAKGGWAWLGVAVGAALAIKFSAVYLVLLVVFTVAWVAARTRRWQPLAELVGTGVIALAVLLGSTWPAVRHVDEGEQARAIGAFLSRWQGSEASAALLVATSHWSVPAAQWGLGSAYVYFNNRTGQGVNYLCGEVSIEGFPHYFPVALALKTSAPFLLGAVWAIAVALRRRDALALALAGTVGFYLLISAGSNYNIGARHLLPILPALALSIGWAVAGRTRTTQALAALALASSALLAFPHYIAHFSLLAAGKGPQCLTDSNLDWGQDWHRLCVRARQQGWSPMAYIYLGAAWPQGEGCAVDLVDSRGPVRPRYVAVSRFAETVGPDYLRVFGEVREAESLSSTLAYLHGKGRLIGDVGGSIRVFRLPDAS